MVSGAWLTWPSSALLHLTDGSEGFALDSSQISTLVALMDFGNFLSPIPTGYLMDLIGRKLTLLITAALYVVASICTLAGDDIWYLYVARLLVGLGKGVVFAVVPIYLAEVANTQIRGGLSTMFIGFLNLGMVFDYVFGPIVSYKTLNILNLVVPVLFGLSFWLVPESPYYLIMKGREGSARKSLCRFRWVSKSDSKEGSPLDSELNGMKETVERDMKNRGRFIDLVTTPGNRKALIIIGMLAIFQRLSGISPTLAYSTTRILPKTGGGLSPSYYMIIFSVILVIANYVAIPLVDKIGRKPLLLASSISSCIVMGCAGIFYYVHRLESVDATGFTWIPYVCLLLFGITYSIGIGFLPSTLVSELFPTNVKSYAGSVSAILLAAISFMVNKMFLAVSENAGVHTMYAIFSISCFMCFLFVAFFVFETKGKSFSEIQDILNSGKRVETEET